jgi:formamidopyrimidine-DNA glycosylase
LEETARAIAGSTVRAVRRRGKQIFFDLDRGVLYVHLGMTGKLLWDADTGKHTRALIRFAEGTLQYEDIRQFGRLEFFAELPSFLERVGPDALTIDFQSFYSRLKAHRGPIKPLLLNQAFVGGLGNIYVDELLFAARMHPKALVGRISRKRAELLHRKMQELLELAIVHRGSSISDYVDAGGERGAFQDLHRVYGKTGQPCPECGSAIRRVVVAQRGTHYCPRCQRA